MKMGLEECVKDFKVSSRLTWRQLQYAYYSKLKHSFYGKDEENWTGTNNH